MANKLKIQKLDRRMSGHQHFMYRLELPYHAFSKLGIAPNDAYINRTKTFFEYSTVLTDIYGYGPSVDDANAYAAVYGQSPAWGFRPLDNYHTYTLYFKDDEVKHHIEKLLMFNILSEPGK